jgi:hypothetical protein
MTLNETECNHLGQCPTPYQIGMHQPKSEGSPYNHTALLTCRHCINLLWEWRWALCDKYGWEQWPESLLGGYEMRLR